MIGLLSGLIASSMLRVRLASGARFRDGIFYALTVLDAVLLVATLFSYSVAYELPFEATVKSPSVAFLLTFVALRALRFDYRFVVVSTVAIAGAWSIAFLLRMHLGGVTLTTSYTRYLTDHAVLLGAEFERLFALLVLAAGLVLSTRRSRATVDRVAAARGELEYLAQHDPLTGLINRARFREELRAALQRRRRGGALAVLYLDLDHFKEVNDTLGHSAGDALLRETARRLRAGLRETETVARRGGDEFAVLLHERVDAGRVVAVAERLLESVSRACAIDGHTVRVGASIGISMVPEDGEDEDAVLGNVDLALARAKQEGRGAYRFFAREMDERVRRRRRLALELRGALERGELELHYQPQVPTNPDGVPSFEALLRWPHPERGLVSPAEFIPIAEETSLIEDIGDWVLRQGCRDAASWPPEVGVAINLSPRQLADERILERVDEALALSGLDPRRLELEITETAMIQDVERCRSVLGELRGKRIRIALDDFGTGYSSLSLLHDFTFDNLKVDRSFVARLEEDDSARAIVRSVSRLGHDLGMTMTAEGVETDAQLAFLRAEGFHVVQGYLFSAARPAREVPLLLERLRRKAA